MKSTIFSYLLKIFIMFCFWGIEMPSEDHIYSQTQFQTTIGGPHYENACSIIQTTDGGYTLAGMTESIGSGNSDIYIVKLDVSGLFQWSKTIGGAGNDFAYSIVRTIDGGYILAGSTTSFGAGNSDMYIVKLDASGSFLWSKTIGGTDSEVAHSVIQTTDGGYALAGSSNSFGAGNSDMYIVKLDASGSYLWSKTIGGTGGEVANSIIQTTEGGLAMTGYFGSSSAIYISKLTASGSIQWSKIMGGINDDDVRSIIQTTDGGYALIGDTYDFPGGNPMYILKLDASGSIQWSKIFGGTGDQHANSIVQTSDGGYALTGQTNSFGAGNWDMFIVKLNADGITCGNSLSLSLGSFNSTPATTEPTSTVNSPTSTVTTSAPTISSGGTTTNICSVVGIESQNEIPNEFKLFQNYPNPFNPSTKINFDIPEASIVKVVIYDVTGKLIATLINENLNPGSYAYDFDATGLSSGVYFYKIITNGYYTETKKMILLK